MGKFKGRQNKKAKAVQKTRSKKLKLKIPGGSNDPNAYIWNIWLVWIVAIIFFVVVFGFLAAEIQAIPLFNNVFTLFGAMEYWDVFTGLLILLIALCCFDLAWSVGGKRR